MVLPVAVSGVVFVMRVTALLFIQNGSGRSRVFDRIRGRLGERWTSQWEYCNGKVKGRQNDGSKRPSISPVPKVSQRAAF